MLITHTPGKPLHSDQASTHILNFFICLFTWIITGGVITNEIVHAIFTVGAAAVGTVVIHFVKKFLRRNKPNNYYDFE